MDGHGMCDEHGQWLGGRYSHGPDPDEPLGIQRREDSARLKRGALYTNMVYRF